MITKNSVQRTEPTMGNMNCSFLFITEEIGKRWKSILIWNLLLSSSTFCTLCAVTPALKPFMFVYRNINPGASKITKVTWSKDKEEKTSNTGWWDSAEGTWIP